MKKLMEKYKQLRAIAKFGVTSSIVFIIGLPSIPYLIYKYPSRLPPWPKWEFVGFCLFINAGCAVFLSGFAVLGEMLIKRFTKWK